MEKYYTVFIYKRFSPRWLTYLDIKDATCKREAIKKAKALYFSDHNITGLSTIMYYGKASEYCYLLDNFVEDKPVEQGD